MLAVDGRGGSILLTDSMRVARISKSMYIGRTDLRGEHSRGRAPFPECIVDDGFRNRGQDALGKRLRLERVATKARMLVRTCIGSVPYGLCRQNVENGKPVYLI
jgi:hypothetical protein